MDFTVVLRSTVVFLTLLTTFASNMEDNLLARLGIETSTGYVVALAIIFCALLTERNVYIVAAVVLFSLNANMPVDFSLNMGVDRDYYAGLMLALILQPILARTMQLN